MNELFVFLDIIAAAGWVYMCALLAVAVGLLVFDRQPKRARADEATQPAAPSAAPSAARSHEQHAA